MTKVIYRMETYGEGDWHIALCPELGISRSGKTPKDAKSEVQEAVMSHLGHCEYQGVLDDVLGDAGFEKVGETWRLAPRSIEEKVAITRGQSAEDPGECRSDGNSYTYTSKSGISLNVRRLSKEDVRQKLSELETKYGMASRDFLIKYHSCGFEEENLEFLDWVWYYDAAADLGLVSTELGSEH